MLFDCGLFQGLKELRLRNWAGLPSSCRVDRRRRADPRAPRPRRLLPRLVQTGLSAAASSAPPAPLSCAGWCCPTRAGSRKRTRARRTGTGTASTPRRCRSTTRADAHRALDHFQPVGYHRAIEVGRRRHGRVHAVGPPARLCVHRRATAAAVRQSCSAATSGATHVRCCPIPSDAVCAPTSCSSSPPMAIAIMSTDDQRRASWRRSFAKPRARRQADHSGVRHRPRRGTAVLDAPARARAPHSRAARLRRQPDGQRSAAVLHPARVTSSTRTCARREKRASCDVRDARFQIDRLAAAVEGAHGQPQDRRSSSRRAAWPLAAACCTTWPRRCPIRRTPCSSSATRPRARAAGSSSTARASVRIHGSSVPVRARIAKIDSMSAHADRGEILRWLGTLPAPPRRLCLVHGEPGPMDALEGARSRASSGGTPRRRSTTRRFRSES